MLAKSPKKWGGQSRNSDLALDLGMIKKMFSPKKKKFYK